MIRYNTSNDTYIFTNDYVSFYVKPELKETVLLPDYLYMIYQSKVALPSNMW